MDIDTLFREHSERLDGALSDISVPPFEDLGRGHRIRRTRVAVAAFGAVAVVAGAAILLPRSANLPVAQSPTTTTSAATTTVVTDDPVALSGVELIASQWTSHKLGTDPRAVLSARSISFVESKGFYIAGTHWAPEITSYQTRMWRSTDGAGWVAVPGSEQFGATRVIGDENGMVAWGEGFVWVSKDGTDWTVSAEIDAPLPRDGLVLDSGEFILYGYEAENFETGSTGEETDLLLSSDGISWDVIPTPVAFSAMVQLDSGDLVATGGQASEPMTWTSTDGRTWTLLSDDLSISRGQGAMVNTLVAAGPGLVAGGTNASGEAAFWVSTDGQTFQQTASFPPNGPINSWPDMAGPPSVQAIAVGEGWMVAVGDYGWGGDQSRGIGGGAIWISRAGIDWEPVPVELIDRRGTGLGDVAYGGSTFVAVGDRNQEPLVLTWEPSEESGFGES